MRDAIILLSLVVSLEAKGGKTMLLQFSVENFRSYKTKAVLSLEASADKELMDNVLSVVSRLLSVVL